jgi:DNA helicase-2/ATP-dependent DNA helicase PcrA
MPVQALRNAGVPAAGHDLRWLPVTPSPQQAEVIAAVAAGGSEDLAVVARAGSGKTTTMISAVAERPPGTRVVMTAFNKNIARELESRLPDKGCRAKTMHQIGMRACARAFGDGLTVDENREVLIAREVCGDQEEDKVHTTVARLAAAAKECAPDEATSPAAIGRIGGDLGILPDDEELPRWDGDRLIAAAAEVVERSAYVDRDLRLSFADMLYIPLVHRLRPEQADLIVVDEAQDLNLAQLRLAARMRRQGGRFVVVGDDRQAIYSWRGAAPGALDRVRTALNARLLKLTVTFRCARRIVAEARRYVPDIEATATAEDGIVRSAGWSALAGAVPGDFVLGRTNASVIEACLALVRANVRAIIRGGNLGDVLVGLVRRLSMGLPSSDLIAFLNRLDTWLEREIAKANRRGAKDGVQAAQDRYDALSVCANDVDTIAELVEKIRRLFADDNRPSVICSTVHRAKGLETPRVWYLQGSFEGRPQDLEEENLRYVAVTRAQRELVYVDSPTPAKDPR